MSPKTPTRRSPPVLLLSMVTGQMFTTGSDEWEIGNGEGGTRGRGDKGTRGQEISFSSSPCLPLSPCPLVPLSPCLPLPTGSRANGFDNPKGGCRANHARKPEPGGCEQR